MVFALSGWVTTNVVSTATNYTYRKNPDFTKLPGAKLLYVTPVVDGTNQPPNTWSGTGMGQER